MGTHVLATDPRIDRSGIITIVREQSLHFSTKVFPGDESPFLGRLAQGLIGTAITEGIGNRLRRLFG